MSDLIYSFWMFNVNAYYEVIYFLMHNFIVLIGISGIVMCFIFEEIEHRQTDITDERTII